MVREQEPTRAPFSPTRITVPMESQTISGQDNDKSEKANIFGKQEPKQTAAHPQFGKPTPLGGSPQHLSTRPTGSQLPNPHATVIAGPPTIDKYSNLFIPSKPTYRPADRSANSQQYKNPLHQAKDWASQQSHMPLDDSNSPSAHADVKQPDVSKPPLVSIQQTSNSMAFRISEPTTLPTWTHKPAGPPVFSSHRSTNPYYTAQNLIDLTTRTIGMATNEALFDDRFGANDPSTFIDSAKANENIKALLEGAFADEDDKLQTRRRKKQLKEKANDLAERFKRISVSGSEELKAVEEEEGHDDDEEEEDEDDGTVEGLKVKLLPHQIEGVEWMRDKELGTKKTRGVLPKGGILADDMGLGKTIQSIALILTNPKPPKREDVQRGKSVSKSAVNADKGTLVVVPLALIKQWEAEIKVRVDEDHTLSVCVHHGPQRTKIAKELKKYDVVITTYHTLVSEHGGSGDSLKVGCFGVNWYRIILDEAHSIKNRNAKATKAACALNAEYRWCLTGTPMQNNLDELQSLIHFLRIKPYDDLNAWRDQITRPMNNGRGGLAIKRLQVYLKAFMKRRTKDILKQEGALKIGNGKEASNGKPSEFKIVKRTVETIKVDFTADERAFYQRMEMRTDKSLEQMIARKNMTYASALVLLLRLRQACNHPQLVKGDLAKDMDVFTNGSGSSSPSRKKAANLDDMDSIAAMLGGLSVQTKRCDVCQIELSRAVSESGAIRCPDCEADLAQEDRKPKTKRVKNDAVKELVNEKRSQIAARPRNNRRIVDDSDDDEEDDDVINLVSDNEELLAPGDDIYSNDETSEDGGQQSDDENPEGVMMSTKIRHLLFILNRDAAQHKYIIFSFFTSMLDLIEPYLKRDGLVYTRYDGQMRNDMREASLDRLRNHAKTRILLCSLRAGSLGLNLTAASRVVILEPFWNPFVEEQAIDRVHRLNQTEDVVVYKMTIKDTVEAGILELQERKRKLAEATIEGKAAAAKLTLQDMLNLFKHDAEHTHQVDGIGLDTGKLLSSDSQQAGSEGRKMKEGSGGSQPARRREHEVYGRRW